MCRRVKIRTLKVKCLTVYDKDQLGLCDLMLVGGGARRAIQAIAHDWNQDRTLKRGLSVFPCPGNRASQCTRFDCIDTRDASSVWRMGRGKRLCHNFPWLLLTVRKYFFLVLSFVHRHPGSCHLLLQTIPLSGKLLSIHPFSAMVTVLVPMRWNGHLRRCPPQFGCPG